MSQINQRRRIVAATVVAAGLLVAGPAAYGVAAATTTVDDPAAVSSAEPGPGQEGDGGPDGSGTEEGQGTRDDRGSGGSQDSGSSEDGADAAGERADAAKGADASGGKGDADGKDGGQNGAAPGVEALATDCSGSKLDPHDGFQKAPRCVSTAFGEVAAQAKSPSLLITRAPDKVGTGQAFKLEVSTRNLVRDRFLAAGQGGYYKETSLLNGDGLQRGHFHTACRVLPNTDEAPDAAPEPAFFQATEDGSGSATPDTVTIDVPGIEQAGELQCSSWAGDGSHRVPMMQRADQTPAFDSVRIDVG